MELNLRPNIVFAFADDWGRYASAYARHQPSGGLNELIETPHFDSVATNGALFLNALVPAPSCTITYTCTPNAAIFVDALSITKRFKATP